MKVFKKYAAAALARLIRVGLLASFLAATLFPIYWMLVTSLKDRLEIYGDIITFWPQRLTWDNYLQTFTNTNFPLYFKNSLIVTVVSSTLVLIVSIMGGYSLARYKFRGKNLVLVSFLITQMVPVMVLLVPLFILFSKINFINRLSSLIITYTVINIPFCLITMSSFFQRIPDALEEAALIDGCGRLQAVLKIIIPVMLPGLVATFVFAFTGSWNDLFFGIMFINNEAARTIPVGLNSFIGKFDINWGQMCAGGIIALIPVAILFMMIQKHIVAGLTQGSVKG